MSGGHSFGEIPVPIPNTEVKSTAPTILGWQRPGKIGTTRLYLSFLFKFSSMIPSKILFTTLLFLSSFLVVGKKEYGSLTVLDCSVDSGNLVFWKELFSRYPNLLRVHQDLLPFCGVCFQCSFAEPGAILKLKLVDQDEALFKKSFLRLKVKDVTLEKCLYVLLEIKKKDPSFKKRCDCFECCRFLRQDSLFLESDLRAKSKSVFSLWIELAEDFFSLFQILKLDEYKYLSLSIFKSLFHLLNENGFALDPNDFQKSIKFIFFKDNVLLFFRLRIPFDLMDEILSFIDCFDLNFCQEFFGVELSAKR